MVTPNQGFKTDNLKPLFFRTPLLVGESITSWLMRASFRQGCSSLSFTNYYWEAYRLWTYDIDKGFNHIDRQIHNDMACLAETSVERFNKQTLTHFAEVTNTLSHAKNQSTQWILPLSKRNRKSIYGYFYCPICFITENIPHLKLHWRLSWYIYCDIHLILLEHKCPHCNSPYQPNLIPLEIKTLNYCHHCERPLTEDYIKNRLMIDETYQLQCQSMTVLQEGKTVIFNQEIGIADWFELMLFYINIARKAAKTKDANYMMYRLYVAMGINTDDMNVNAPRLEESDTGLIFDYLPVHERIRFMAYANMLMIVSLEQWLQACEQIKASQNSFYLHGHKRAIPKAFLPVFSQLPIKAGVIRKAKNTQIKPSSIESVKKSWQRLQRKMEGKTRYE